MKKPPKCKQCGAEYVKRSMGQKVCGLECAIKYSREQKQKEEDVEHKKRKKAYKANDNTLQAKLAQDEFNKWIRWRDREKPCISCGKPPSKGKRNACHYKSVGARLDLRFNEDNVHGGCEKCNSYLGGNLAPYRVELIKRIGIVRVEALDVHREPQRLRAADYITIKQEYRYRLKNELQS